MAIPPNVAVERGAPAMTFAGTDRTMFCGGQDLTPERDGYPAIHWTSEWVERFGGVTSTFTQDPGAGHGGFHQDPLHIRAALEAFRDNLALRRGSPRPSARWKVVLDADFEIQGASIASAGFVSSEVWLTVGTRGLPRRAARPNCTCSA